MTHNRVFSYLLMLTFLVAVVAAPLGLLMLEGHRESLATIEVRQLGAQVFTAWRLDPAIQSASRLEVPSWRLWLEYVVDGVDFANCREAVGDEDLACLRPLSHLTWLRVYNSKTTNAGLRYIAGLQKLKWLELRKAPISDAGLTHIAILKRLRWLDLRDTLITNAGLASFEGMTQLKFLNLQGTRVTFAAVEKLQKRLPNTKILFGRHPDLSRASDGLTGNELRAPVSLPIISESAPRCCKTS